jgi:hypothetical protein
MEAMYVLLGALVGIFGSVWVSRREVRREHRIRLYDELLPRVLSREPNGDISWDRTLPVVRSATIGGRKDRRLALAVQETVGDLVQSDIPHHFDPNIGWIPDNPMPHWFETFRSNEARAEQSVKALEQHLQERIL